MDDDGRALSRTERRSLQQAKEKREKSERQPRKGEKGVNSPDPSDDSGPEDAEPSLKWDISLDLSRKER